MNNNYYFLFYICIQNACFWIICTLCPWHDMTKNLNSKMKGLNKFPEMKYILLEQLQQQDKSWSVNLLHVWTFNSCTYYLLYALYIIIMINFTIETWYIWIMYMFNCTLRYMLTSVVVPWCSALALRPNFMAFALSLNTKALALRTSALEISFRAAAQGRYIFVFPEHNYVMLNLLENISGLPSRHNSHLCHSV